ncbi:MAG: translation initiation factor IF-2, partial [Cyclobacteriaceae bacterium]
MAEEKSIRLGQASRKLNVGHTTILEFLEKKGFKVENNPNAKLTAEQFALLSREYASSASEKLEASHLSIGVKHSDQVMVATETAEAHRKKVEEDERILIKNLGSKEIVKPREEPKPEKVEREKPKLEGVRVVGKIDLDKKKTEEAPVAEVKPEKETEKTSEKEVEPVVAEKPQPVEQELIKAKADKLQGLKVLDRIELPTERKKEAGSADEKKKRPRKRIPAGESNQRNRPGQRALPPRVQKEEPSEKEIQDKIRATLARLSGGQRKFQSGAKYRKEKRQANFEAQEERIQQEQEQSKTLKVTEFISANDLASLMNVSVNDVIS